MLGNPITIKCGAKCNEIGHNWSLLNFKREHRDGQLSNIYANGTHRQTFSVSWFLSTGVQQRLLVIIKKYCMLIVTLVSKLEVCWIFTRSCKFTIHKKVLEDYWIKLTRINGGCAQSRSRADFSWLDTAWSIRSYCLTHFVNLVVYNNNYTQV